MAKVITSLSSDTIETLYSRRIIQFTGILWDVPIVVSLFRSLLWRRRRRWAAAAARLSWRCDITTVERCAPIVHINQKYPIYNYCRSRLIYIYTLWDNIIHTAQRPLLCDTKSERQSRRGSWDRGSAIVSNRLLNCVMTVTDESDIYIRLGLVQRLKIRAPEPHLILINNL